MRSSRVVSVPGAVVVAVAVVCTAASFAAPAARPPAPSDGDGTPSAVAARQEGGNASEAGEESAGLQDGAAAERFEAEDVFQLEIARDPRISPDGERVVYVRSRYDIMNDRRRSDLWIVDVDGTGHQPLVTGVDAASPRWSPEGDRLAYAGSGDEGERQLFVRWMESGRTAAVTHLTRSPSSLAWSPDGEWLAFSMFVEEPSTPFVQLPGKPEGADWAQPARVIDDLQYRADGSGYLEDGYRQIFVVPAEGATPRRLTSGPYDHGGPLSWSPDGGSIVFSANRHEDGRYDPLNSEVYEVSVADGSISALTDRQGPDGDPTVSPDGERIAYTGFDDRRQGYQVTRLHVMGRDGSDPRVLTGELDRSVQSPVWAADGSGLTFLYDDEGEGKVAFVDLEGRVETLAGDVGGLSVGRPYGAGQFSVARDGRLAYTHTRPDHPADVAVGGRGDGSGPEGPADGDDPRITRLNADLFGPRHVQLGEVEEIWYESSHDGRRIQGWIVKPPGFDPSRSHPLVLEIHGGPFANYGPRFSAEVQLYAAAGYVVLYTNPRGSTSYGQEFGNLIHHAYPGEDYDDLMSGVDAVLEKGYVDEERLYVTGGSGGGVLTAWIVGKTDRFRAAVVAKPVINWTSFVLTADSYPFFYKYWFPGFPWEHPDHYWERSPLSLAGDVSTPTMLLTGEADYRTPISETEQYYQALKLRKVDTVMVRIPEASHGIASRPSTLISKVAHILKWFELHGGEAQGEE